MNYSKIDLHKQQNIVNLPPLKSYRAYYLILSWNCLKFYHLRQLEEKPVLINLKPVIVIGLFYSLTKNIQTKGYKLNA